MISGFAAFEYGVLVLETLLRLIQRTRVYYRAYIHYRPWLAVTGVKELDGQIHRSQSPKSRISARLSKPLKENIFKWGRR